jgi:SPP1 family predicted phage head-tail adaptor
MIVPKEIIKRKNRVSCIGDMSKRVHLHNRALQVPEFEDYDVSEEFSGTKTVWANVRTVSGETFFTGVGIDIGLSHEIIIRYDVSVSSETWIEFEGNNLKIVSVENLDERDEYLRLRCSNRGDKNLGAAQG